MFVRSKKAIIAFVNRCLLGQPGREEQLELGDYDVDETFYFWTMYGIGSSVVTGAISKETARKEQERVGLLFRQMAVQIYLWRKLRTEQLMMYQKYSLTISKADRHLRNGEAVEFLFALTDAFSAITGERIHGEMFRRAMENEDFKKDLINAFIFNAETITQKFGDAIKNESYLQLLEKFFTACVEDGTAELFNGFGDETDEADMPLEIQTDLHATGENSMVMYGVKQFG